MTHDLLLLLVYPLVTLASIGTLIGRFDLRFPFPDPSFQPNQLRLALELRVQKGSLVAVST